MVAAPPSTFDRIFGAAPGREGDAKSPGRGPRATSPSGGLGNGLCEEPAERLKSVLGARRRHLSPPGATGDFAACLSPRRAERPGAASPRAASPRAASPPRDLFAGAWAADGPPAAAGPRAASPRPRLRSPSPARAPSERPEPHILPGAPPLQRCRDNIQRTGEDTRSVIRTFPEAAHYRSSSPLRTGSPALRQKAGDEHNGATRADGLFMGGPNRRSAETTARRAAELAASWSISFTPPGAGEDEVLAVCSHSQRKGDSSPFTPLARYPKKRHSPSPAARALGRSDAEASATSSAAAADAPPSGPEGNGGAHPAGFVASPRRSHELLHGRADFLQSPGDLGKRYFPMTPAAAPEEEGALAPATRVGSPAPNAPDGAPLVGLDKGLCAEPTEFQRDNFLGSHRRRGPSRGPSPARASPPTSPRAESPRRAFPSWSAVAEGSAGSTPASAPGAVQSSWRSNAGRARQHTAGVGPAATSYAWEVADAARFRRREAVTSRRPQEKRPAGAVSRWRM